MSDHEAAIRTRLLAVTGVTDLVGSRVWYSVLPQEPASGGYMPALVVQLIDSPHTYRFGGTAGKARSRVQVDTWAENRAGCEALMAEVTSALKTFSGTVGGIEVQVVGMGRSGPRWDSDAKLYSGRHDFELWGDE